jgi:pimeloyl-ACP methyl ester carboxylesterase
MRLLRTVLGTAGFIGGLAVLNERLKERGDPPRLGGEERCYRWRGGELAYQVAGSPEAPPLLLVHGIYAGASSYEFRKNFAELSKSFRVHTLDLLGCGLSDKPRRRYGPEDIGAQVEDFVREEVSGRVHLIASSLSAALVMPVAVRSPRLFKRLVFICPTGLGSLNRPSGLLGDLIYGLSRAPVLGDTLYHAISSRQGIRYYLENMVYYDPKFVTDSLVEDYYGASHGPRSKYLPTAFISGKLNLGVAGYFPRIPHKVLIAWGQEARTTPVAQINNFLRINPRSEPRIFRDAGLLPHDERADTFNEEVRAFLLGEPSR